MRISRFSNKLISSLFLGLWLGLLVLNVYAESNEQFGRLFSKPNERNNLNILRQNQKLKTIAQQEAQKSHELVNDEPPELPDPITLQGYVKRSDGQSNTLWVNNKAIQEDSTIDKVKIGRLNQRGFSNKGVTTEGVDVKIPANGKHIHLKAGQMYEPESNHIYEMQVVEKAKRLRLEQSGFIDDNASSNKNTSDNNAE
jgi:nitrogen-specific signal transduction histidine kinase